MSFTTSLCSRNMPGISGRKIISFQAGLKNGAYKRLRTQYPNDMWQKRDCPGEKCSVLHTAEGRAD